MELLKHFMLLLSNETKWTAFVYIEPSITFIYCKSLIFPLNLTFCTFLGDCWKKHWYGSVPNLLRLRSQMIQLGFRVLTPSISRFYKHSHSPPRFIVRLDITTISQQKNLICICIHLFCNFSAQLHSLRFMVSHFDLIIVEQSQNIFFFCP